MTKSCLLLLAALLPSGAIASEGDAPSTSNSARYIGCYSATDATRYNRLKLRLFASGLYEAQLQGDITTWGASSGAWRVDGNDIVFEMSPSESNRLPERVAIEREDQNVALRIPEGYEWSPASGFEALRSESCK